jgi:hypothetical protein
MDDLFSQLMKSKPYTGMYPGADPYNKAEMVREKIPSASQEALQEPAIDPIKAATLGAATGAGMVMSPGGAIKDMLDKYLVNGLFSYLLQRSMFGNTNKPQQNK